MTEDLKFQNPFVISLEPSFNINIFRKILADKSLFRLLYSSTSTVQRLEISKVQNLEVSRLCTLEIS